MVVRRVRACNLSSISRSLITLLVSTGRLQCDLVSVVVDSTNFSVPAPLSEIVIEICSSFRLLVLDMADHVYGVTITCSSSCFICLPLVSYA